MHRGKKRRGDVEFRLRSVLLRVTAFPFMSSPNKKAAQVVNWTEQVTDMPPALSCAARRGTVGGPLMISSPLLF
jgi:hypothetical protein